MKYKFIPNILDDSADQNIEKMNVLEQDSYNIGVFKWANSQTIVGMSIMDLQMESLNIFFMQAVFHEGSF